MLVIIGLISCSIPIISSASLEYLMVSGKFTYIMVFGLICGLSINRLHEVVGYPIAVNNNPSSWIYLEGYQNMPVTSHFRQDTITASVVRL